MSSLSDENLIASCVAGNREHYRLLYERHKDYVAALVWRMVENREAARDLTQDIFIKAFKGLRKFRGKSSFKTWISRIAVNRCKDYQREIERKHVNEHVSLNAPEVQGGMELPDRGPASNPRRQVLQKELKEAVEAAMNKLSSDHKTAILLRQEGFSYEEIASITMTTQETVGSRIYYAKMYLRDFLKPYIQGKPDGKDI